MKPVRTVRKIEHMLPSSALICLHSVTDESEGERV